MIPTEELDDISECFERSWDQDDINACVRESDLDMLARGTNRFVFEIDDERVAKIPLPGAKSNQREVDTWESLPPQLRDHFAEIEAHDGNNWLVMEKVEEVDRETFYDIVDDFEPLLEQNDWSCADIRPTNFGTDSDGKYKFFDYERCGKI